MATDDTIISMNFYSEPVTLRISLLGDVFRNFTLEWMAGFSSKHGPSRTPGTVKGVLEKKNMSGAKTFCGASCFAAWQAERL